MTDVVIGHWNYIKKLSNIISGIWKNNRWELFVCISILVLIISYFFNTNKTEYQGLKCDVSLLKINKGSSYKTINNKKKSRFPKKKNETECRRIMENLFRVPFSSIRPNFLKNPKTNRNLELDMFNKDLDLALEYQGAQHRTYTPFFHKTYKDYTDQVSRDEYKKKRCIEEGIDLICVPDSVPFNNLGNYIKDELRKIKRIP
jgi:hypothetical protein